jgi:hypothetical protein
MSDSEFDSHDDSDLDEPPEVFSSGPWRIANQISIVGDQLSYKGHREVFYLHEDVGIAIAMHRFSQSRKYFEILIVEPGKETEINLGAVSRDYPLDRFPGWDPGSAAYHADDGALYDEVARSNYYNGEKLGICSGGDRMGCGVQFPGTFLEIEGSAGEDRENIVTVFFTKNGEEVGSCQQRLPSTGLFPAVGIRSLKSLVAVDMTSFLDG